MKRLVMFAAAALAAAPLLAEDPKPAPQPQTETITLSGVNAPQDSPLVAAAKKSKKKSSAKKKVVITNATLNKDASTSNVTTTKTLPDINMPPDPLVAAEHQARPAPPKPKVEQKVSPEQQKKNDAVRARADEEGLFEEGTPTDAAAARADQAQPATPPAKKP